MQSGASALQSLRGGLADGLVWWRDELAGLVPERVRRQFVGGRPETVLVQVDDGFVVVKDAAASRSTKARESAVLPRPEAITQLVRAARSNAEATVGVRLPADVCFARNVELPVAARNDLRRILDFDLERATPFKHRDVYTAHVVEGEATSKGKLRVRQLVTKRGAVDPLVAEVRAAGLEVGFVDCWADQPSVGMPINFMEPRGGAERGPTGFFRPVRVLLALALLLILSALVLTLWGYESALAELQGKTAQARTQAAAVRGVLERSDAVVADLVRLQDTKQKRTLAIEVLEEVSRVLPDTVWLNELRLEGDVLDISGLAPSGAALPTMLGRSAILTDAALTAPVTFDQREDKERFSVRVRVKHQAGLRRASVPERE
jgi:general secretion pathway protein L